MKKWLIGSGYVSAIILIIVYKEAIMSWIYKDSSNDFLLLFGAAVLLGLVPGFPYGVVAGVIGARYGSLLGGFINVVSSTLAAALLFYLVRVLFQDKANQILRKSRHIDRLTTLMEQNAFFAVLFARLIPIVPAALINIYAAVSRIRFRTFAAATLIGKIPVMLVFAAIGDQLLSSIRNVLWISFVYIIFLCLVFFIYRWFRSNKRNQSE